jgi:hypothetical protein
VLRARRDADEDTAINTSSHDVRVSNSLSSPASPARPFIMIHARFTITLVASLALAALATPTPPFKTVPLKKVGKITSTRSLLEKDLRRYNSAPASSSGAVENDLVSYIAPVKVGSQTFDLIVDTGSALTFLPCDSHG